MAPRSTRPFHLLRLTKWAPGSSRHRVLKSESWTQSIKRGRKVFLKVKVLNWTWPTDPVMYGYKKKKLVWPTNKADLGVCYQLLCTNLGDGILCTLLSNHNIHGCLSAMDNVCFSAKKCVGYAFNSKKTQSLRKNGCRQKCLDKSLHVTFFFYLCFIKT